MSDTRVEQAPSVIWRGLFRFGTISFHRGVPVRAWAKMGAGREAAGTALQFCHHFRDAIFVLQQFEGKIEFPWARG
jgi:hypothetical protein